MGHLGPELALGGSSEALKFQMGLEGAEIGPQESLDEAMRAMRSPCEAGSRHQRCQSRCGMKITSELVKFSGILLGARDML